MSELGLLQRLFEADLDMRANEWDKQFPGYKGHSEAGGKLWWSPLPSVWRSQGEPPDWSLQHHRAHWAEAWTYLQQQHADYLAAKAAAEAET